MGDVNINMRNLNRNSSHLLDIFETYNLCQIVSEPMRKNNLLDILAISNAELVISSVSYIDLHELSDHQMIYCDLKIKCSKPSPKSESYWQKYQEMRNFVTEAVRREKEGYVNYIHAKKDTRLLWKTLEQLIVHNITGNQLPALLAENLIEGQLEYITVHTEMVNRKGENKGQTRTVYTLPQMMDETGMTDVETMFTNCSRLRTELKQPNTFKVVVTGKMDMDYLRKCLEYVFGDSECKVTIVNHTRGKPGRITSVVAREGKKETPRL
nr:unnamed protein product [Callosobruchus analis]